MKEFIVKEYETFPYKNAVNEMPELIRCKDCKYWETDDDESFCSDWGAYGTGAESYCSFAKRKEE